MHLVCSHCLQINRVEPRRLDEHPRCGKCHESLLRAAPIALAGEAFTRFLAHHELPVLVDYWAAWCGPCRAMAPAFEGAARERPRVGFVKLDTEADASAAGRARIQSIPTLVLYERGAERTRVSGALPQSQLVRWLDAALASS